MLASGNNGYDLDPAFEIAGENIETFEGTDLQNVILVLYGNHAVTVIEKYGYEVLEIPEDIHKTKMNQIFADGREVTQIFFENRMAEPMFFLKDEKNQKMILENGHKGCRCCNENTCWESIRRALQ